jgi:MoaA/NifB/PqqE/SkfB family radical SAM enzyme
MTLADFKIIIDKMPRVLTQAALGLLNISTNPDFFPMMEYAREKGVIPNYTCHGLDVTEEVAKKTAALCGAVAVSIVDKEKTYDAVKMFTDAGMKQVNIHAMVSRETMGQVRNTIQDRLRDPRLAKLNAIVLLSLKTRGRGEGFHPLDYAEFAELVQLSLDSKIGIGFDSCSCRKFLETVRTSPDFNRFSIMAEPCESTLFSTYIDAHGLMHPCSFSPGTALSEVGECLLYKI